MSKFKEGDKIKLLKGMDYAPEGSILVCVNDYEIKVDGDGYYYSEKFANTEWVNRVPYKFELVKEENKMKFDMKTQPWFIRIDHENYDSVNAWLVENFGKSCHHLNDSSLPYYAFVTNSVGEGATNFHSMVYVSNTADQRAKEIKLNFKTVVDSVEWPEVETEAQKKIRELEETINSAQEQIQKLKGEIK